MWNGANTEPTVIEVQPAARREGVMVKLALALSTVAVSAMGIFLVQWGRAQETVANQGRHGVAIEQDLEHHKEAQDRLNHQVSRQLGRLDLRTARTADLVESIAKKLDVPVPPPRR